MPHLYINYMLGQTKKKLLHALNLQTPLFVLHLTIELDVCLSVHRRWYEERDQLDATQ